MILICIGIAYERIFCVEFKCITSVCICNTDIVAFVCLFIDELYVVQGYIDFTRTWRFYRVGADLIYNDGIFPGKKLYVAFPGVVGNKGFFDVISVIFNGEIEVWVVISCFWIL